MSNNWSGATLAPSQPANSPVRGHPPNLLTALILSYENGIDFEVHKSTDHHEYSKECGDKRE